MQLKQQKMVSNRKPVDYIERIRLLQIITMFGIRSGSQHKYHTANAGIWIYKQNKWCLRKVENLHCMRFPDLRSDVSYSSYRNAMRKQKQGLQSH